MRAVGKLLTVMPAFHERASRGLCLQFTQVKVGNRNTLTRISIGCSAKSQAKNVGIARMKSRPNFVQIASGTPSFIDLVFHNTVARFKDT